MSATAAAAGIGSTARTGRARPALAWPGPGHLALCGRLAVVVTLVFAVVYGGADAAARLHSYRADFYLPIDAAIPFVPWTTVVYSSLYLMFALVPFALRREEEVRACARVLCLQIAIAGLCFLVAPMADRPLPPDLGRLAGAFRVADLINLDFNQFPSLHATFGFTCGWLVGRQFGRVGRFLMLSWAVAIGAAALLTWQHAVLDIAGAAALSAGVLRAYPCSRESGDER